MSDEWFLERMISQAFDQEKYAITEWCISTYHNIDDRTRHKAKELTCRIYWMSEQHSYDGEK